MGSKSRPRVSFDYYWVAVWQSQSKSGWHLFGVIFLFFFCVGKSLACHSPGQSLCIEPSARLLRVFSKDREGSGTAYQISLVDTVESLTYCSLQWRRKSCNANGVFVDKLGRR